MEKLLFTRAEVAELLGISIATVESLNRSGQLQSVRIGRNTRISADALAAFVKVGTKDSTASASPAPSALAGEKGCITSARHRPVSCSRLRSVF